MLVLSIHAPTRGATSISKSSSAFCCLSIHAPTRGATNEVQTAVNNYFFQSTLLQEERHLSSSFGSYPSILSIHAPTRGATFLSAFSAFSSVFQSTLLQEERPCMYEEVLQLCSFNPRSYKRSDNGVTSDGFNYVLSIHAPTRGATAVSLMFIAFLCFQSTLLQEERRYNVMKTKD